MYKKLLRLLTQFSTKQLMVIAGVAGLLPILILFVAAKETYSGKPIEVFLIVLALFIWGFIGLPMIIRKESPGLITLHGRLAQLQGLLIMLSFWTPVMIIVISVVMRMLR